MFKWIALLLGVPIAVVILELLAVTWIESLQARQLASRQPEVNPRDEARTAVVYFSRSGNTALAARQIARHLDARLFALEAPAYSLGLSGLLHALKDAYRLQLLAFPHVNTLALALVEDHFDELLANRLPQIASVLGVCLGEVRDALQILSLLVTHLSIVQYILIHLDVS